MCHLHFLPCAHCKWARDPLQPLRTILWPSRAGPYLSQSPHLSLPAAFTTIHSSSWHSFTDSQNTPLFCTPSYTLADHLSFRHYLHWPLLAADPQDSVLVPPPLLDIQSWWLHLVSYLWIPPIDGALPNVCLSPGTSPLSSGCILPTAYSVSPSGCLRAIPSNPTKSELPTFSSSVPASP